jgi:hypothetical protein
MRWIKHLTLAHDDPAISSLLEQFGAEGYGIWWLLLEHVAIGIEKDSKAVPSRTHSVVDWAKICCCSARRLREFARISTELRLISSSSPAELKQFASRLPADRLQIDVPKLLKYRDEYSKKSGQTPKQTSNSIHTAGEQSEHTTAAEAEAPPAETSLARSLGAAPLTARAIRECFPATDDRFITRLTNDVAQKVAGLNGQARGEPTDELIADAVRTCHEPGQTSAGLFLHTVPECISTWLTQGRTAHIPNGAGGKESATDKVNRKVAENLAKGLPPFG